MAPSQDACDKHYMSSQFTYCIRCRMFSYYQITFFKALEECSKATTIHIICDNGRSNKNKKVDEHLETSRIKVHYLSPYSPNLNPIERLWKVLREKKTYSKCYEKFVDFKIEIRNFFF